MSTFIPSPITPKVIVSTSRMTPAPVVGGRKRILLVDADGASQKRRADMLRKRGVEVTCAFDMVNATQFWHADSYNLVIVDATDVHDDAVAFCKLMKDERPQQMVSFLVGQPEFLAPSPLPNIRTHNSAALTAGTAHALLKSASDKFSRGTGIMNCASQMSTRRSLNKRQSADRAATKITQEISFGEAVRRAGGD
jgi:CheY-like chemotaxis protein